MKILGPKGHELDSYESWKEHAGPKGKATQWVQGYSACELAHAWFPAVGRGPVIPAPLRALLDSHELTRNRVVEKAFVEHKVRFDDRKGEPRNTDMLLVLQGSPSAVISVEAKAGESFGQTIRGARKSANEAREGNPRSKDAERRAGNPRSQATERLDYLVRTVLAVDVDEARIEGIRYQLLTAALAAVAAAEKHGAEFAGLVVHSFVGMPGNSRAPSAFESTDRDLNEFIRALSGDPSFKVTPDLWAGPYRLPGDTKRDWPDLFIGKINTRPI